MSYTRGRGTRAGWVAWAILTGLAAAGGCIGDAEVPDCVLTHSCSVGGEGGGAGGEDQALAAGAAGEPGVGGVGSGTRSAASGGEGGGDGGAGKGAGGEAGGADCETCAITPAELTAPCAGKPYRATLHVEGGEAPYQWRLSPAVEDWSIASAPESSSRAVLYAESAAPGTTTVAVRVVDARGLETALTYDAHARDACWFAYTGQDAGTGRLALLDPLAELPDLVIVDHDGVYDFRFSPDGRYLVYRHGQSDDFPQGRHLSLIELATLDEQPLSFEERAVTAYAWSPDASVLAVGFEADGRQYLGGFRMPAPNSTDSPSMLAPTPSYVEDNLTWVGSDHVAYVADIVFDANGDVVPENPDHLRTPLWAKLEQGTFSLQPPSIVNFDSNVALQPAADGFWIVNWLITFFPIEQDPLSSQGHWGAALVSPSGKYSASNEETPLALIAARDGNLGAATASAKPDEPCSMLLAWSNAETIACVYESEDAAASGDDGEVQFFSLEPGNPELRRSRLGGFCADGKSADDPTSCIALRNGYGYGTSEAAHAPRVFSTSGRWFAFTRAADNDVYLYWADTSKSEPQLSGALLLGEVGAPSRLSFSPNERQVALQAGSTLFVKKLATGLFALPIDTQLTIPLTCSEDFTNAPATYCGNDGAGDSFKWAPDSAALAFRRADSMFVADVSHAFGVVRFDQPLPLCKPPLCSGDFEFQPSIRP